MALTSYSGLITALGDWLERGDTATLAPDWIALAEARMNRELRVNDMIARATATISSGFSEVPTGFLQPRSMRLSASPGTLLSFITPEQMADVKMARATGTPVFFALVGSEFEFGPAPTDDLDVVLSYYKKVPALSESNTSNWLLASHPDAYLAGALLEAGIYYADAEIVSTNEAKFANALEAIRSASRGNMAANLAPTPGQYAV